MRQKNFSIFLIISFLFLSINIQAQTFKEEVQAFQQEMNEQFKNPEESPLPKEEVTHFDVLPFFKAKEKYKVKAQFKRTENEIPFEMKTTTDRLPVYQKYGELTFNLNRKKHKLNVYQNLKLMDDEEYKDYLFLPFTDLTSGNESYGGGRFLDLKIPEGNIIIVNFNKAYNPYCAYSSRYSCPITPRENHLKTKVKAGVKAPEGH